MTTNCRPWYSLGILPLLLSSYTIVTTVGFLVYFYL